MSYHVLSSDEEETVAHLQLKFREASLDNKLCEMFLNLYEEWVAETCLECLHSRMVEHPAYQKIIAMGKPVIPLIFIALAESSHCWYEALRILTGENPVNLDPCDLGRINKIDKAWLDWGRQHGYLK